MRRKVNHWKHLSEDEKERRALRWAPWIGVAAAIGVLALAECFR